MHLLQTQGSDAAALLSKCLVLYGDWLAETRSQSPNVILEKYLSRVVMLHSLKHAHNWLQLHSHETSSFIIRLHQLHEMQTTVIDNPGVCLFVTWTGCVKMDVCDNDGDCNK